MTKGLWRKVVDGDRISEPLIWAFGLKGRGCLEAGLRQFKAAKQFFLATLPTGRGMEWDWTSLVPL